MRKLDFVIVGTFKASTSTLAFSLQSHENINIPNPKDPYYFLRDYCKTLSKPERFTEIQNSSIISSGEEFERCFQDKHSDGTLYGEATPLYLYKHEEAIPQIKLNNPDMKIIIVLRNPVDRAFSNYMHNVKDGFERRSFSDVLSEFDSLESDEVHPFFHYIRSGFYFEQVQAYVSSFKDVHLVIYEEFVKNPNAGLKEISDFLGVSALDQELKLSRLNKTGRIRSKAINKFLMEESLVKSVIRPVYRKIVRNARSRRLVAEAIKNRNISSKKISNADRVCASKVFKQDVRECTDVVGIDLGEIWGL